MLNKINLYLFILLLSCTTNEYIDEDCKTINSNNHTFVIRDSLIIDKKKNLDLSHLPPNESLKNGYSLIYEVSEDNTQDGGYIQSLNLIKGSKHIKELSSTSYPMDSRYLGHVLDDFDSFFILESSNRGSYPPIWIDKIDKSSGNKERVGLLADYNKNEKILIFIKKSMNKDLAFMYDFEREEIKNIVIPFSTKELKNNCSPFGLRTCLTLDTVTSEYVLLTTDKYDTTATRYKIHR